MSRAPGVSDGYTGGQHPAAETIGDPRQHQCLAALQMIRAFGVHDNAIRCIDGDDGGILPQRPERYPFESGSVSLRIGVHEQKLLEDRLGFCRRHADTDT